MGEWEGNPKPYYGMISGGATPQLYAPHDVIAVIHSFSGFFPGSLFAIITIRKSHLPVPNSKYHHPLAVPSNYPQTKPSYYLQTIKQTLCHSHIPKAPAAVTSVSESQQTDTVSGRIAASDCVGLIASDKLYEYTYSMYIPSFLLPPFRVPQSRC